MTDPSPTSAVGAADPDEAADRFKRRAELLAAILLGLAALSTAWAAYQSGKLGGDELQAFTESNQALADANFFYSQGRAQLDSDNQLFVQYAVAVTEGNADLADYVRGQLMSPALQEAVAWWETTDEALTPFDALEGNPYLVEAYETADGLQSTAGEKLELAQDIGSRGDQYDLASVLLAVSLFFGGISIVFDRAATVYGLLGVSAVTLATGLAVLVSVG